MKDLCRDCNIEINFNNKRKDENIRKEKLDKSKLKGNITICKKTKKDKPTEILNWNKDKLFDKKKKKTINNTKIKSANIIFI